MLAQPYEIAPAMMSGLSGPERDAVGALMRVWNDHLVRNVLRERYYRAWNRLRDLDIAIPPQLKRVETCVGWAAKAVDMLAGRSVFDGFTFAGERNEGLDTLLDAQAFSMTYEQACVSELTHSCSFVTATAGDIGAGEPPVILSAYPAVQGAALWDWRRKRVAAGMVVADFTRDSSGHSTPSQVNLFTAEAVVVMRRAGNGRWVSERLANPAGRPLIEPLVYRPSLTRPFGKSRISRTVMSIVDSAVRECLRTEVSSEFFTAPQRYLLGADEDTFGPDERRAAEKIKSYVSTLAVFTANENGDIPQYGQLPQMSMEPHVSYLQSLAKQFAGETGIPVSSLGVVQDNPASAEAMHAATDDLVCEAEALNRTNGVALRQVALMALSLMAGTPIGSLSPFLTSVKANFRSPLRPSLASQADAAQKIAATVPEFAGTRTYWRMLGFTDAEIEEVLAETRRTRAQMSMEERARRALSGQAQRPVLAAGADA